MNGRAIFDQRVEYPLPPKQGVRDYVFNFVPDSDGYGKGARHFLKRFYPKHVHRNASSLEDLIGRLHADVTANGVSQIRELVLVAHGTTQGLIVPVVQNVTETNLREFRYVTSFSLTFLQKDFSDGKFAPFRQKRREVVARLREDSWVTLRACRVGSSADVMYSLFSFFGGRANVYAPREFQFFGSHPLREGMRIETKLGVHEHLVKQRFLPHDLHTPERKNAIVRSLVDPGRFSEPFELASTRIGDTTSAAAVQYEQFVRSLNGLRINPDLKTRFAAHDHDLSGNARVRVKHKDLAWLVRDAVTHNGVRAVVEYDVGEVVGTSESGTGQDATLRASASVVDAVSSRRVFPIQLFFYESENNLWKGRLGVLAAYLDQPGAEADKQRLEALLLQLPKDTTSVTVRPDVSASFRDHARIELLPAARIRLLSKTGTGETERMTWAVEDGTRYQVKLEHPVTGEGVRSHSLAVYSWLDGKERLLEEYELMSHLGKDPDTPGPELATYLDRFTIDELIGLIDHLRSPYKPAHSFYIHHAQQAIRRKKEYFAWFSSRFADSTDPLGPLVDPYEALSGREAEDKRLLAHDFDFNSSWQEVKVSHRALPTVQQDLFAEEDLAEKLRLVPDRTASVTLDPDSPYTDLEELRQLEAQGLERYFATEKSTFEPAEDAGLSCEELRVVLERWKELQGTDPEEMKRLLGLEMASDGKSFLDHIHWLSDKFKIAKIGLDLFDISFMREGLAVKIASRIPLIGTPTALGVPTTFTALLRIAPAITIPLTLWLKTLEAQAEADQVWENTGKLTAARQWLRALKLLTFRDAPLPDPIVIDLGWAGSNHPHIDRYYQEQRDEDGYYSPFVFAPDRMKKGFEEGVKLMEQAGDEILDRVDEAIDDVLREVDIDACKAEVLTDAGLLDLQTLRKEVVRSIANDLLAKLPKV